MRISFLTAGAALLLCQSAAMAQTNTPQANGSASSPRANPFRRKNVASAIGGVIKRAR
jgi:hypothetical protein